MSFNTPPPPPPPSGPPLPPPGPPLPPGGPPPPPGGYPPGGYVPGGSGPGGDNPSWPPSGAKPPSYLVWAILTTVFCCLPFGIASIVFAARVDSKYNAGDLAGAIEASNNARKWAIVSALVMVGFFAVWFVIALLATATSG